MDDRFVARRGSQGDDWNWQGTPPPEPRGPRPERASLLASLKRSASQARAAAATVLSRSGEAFSGFAGAVRRALPSPRPAERQAPPQQAEPQEAPVRAARLRALRAAMPRPRLRLAIPKRPTAITWPAVRAPRWPALRRRLENVPDDMRAPLAMFGALAAVSVLAIALAITLAVTDDSSGSGAPGPTAAGSSETPSPETPTGTPGGETPGTETPPAETPQPVPTVSVPQGNPVLGMWADGQSAWWFGELGGQVALYEEGDYVPFVLRWDATPGQLYNVQLVYDCGTADAFGAIDYLSGLQAWSNQLLLSPYGPGRERPDSAVPVPDTPDFAPDDGDAGVFFLFGGRFPVLPAAPSPGDNCQGQRSITLPIEATESSVYITGSAHLATASTFGHEEGASSHEQPFGVQAIIDGVGTASLRIAPDAIPDTEH